MWDSDTSVEPEQRLAGFNESGRRPDGRVDGSETKWVGHLRSCVEERRRVAYGPRGEARVNENVDNVGLHLENGHEAVARTRVDRVHLASRRLRLPPARDSGVPVEFLLHFLRRGATTDSLKQPAERPETDAQVYGRANASRSITERGKGDERLIGDTQTVLPHQNRVGSVRLEHGHCPLHAGSVIETERSPWLVERPRGFDRPDDATLPLRISACVEPEIERSLLADRHVDFCFVTGQRQSLCSRERPHGCRAGSVSPNRRSRNRKGRLSRAGPSFVSGCRVVQLPPGVTGTVPFSKPSPVRS